MLRINLLETSRTLLCRASARSRNGERVLTASTHDCDPNYASSAEKRISLLAVRRARLLGEVGFTESGEAELSPGREAVAAYGSLTMEAPKSLAACFKARCAGAWPLRGGPRRRCQQFGQLASRRRFGRLQCVKNPIAESIDTAGPDATHGDHHSTLGRCGDHSTKQFRIDSLLQSYQRLLG